MIVSMIVAVSANGVIGNNGSLPWKLPNDLRRFKELTVSKAVIMGRKTFESLPNGPLKDRVNVIITRQEELKIPNCLVTSSLPAALDLLERMGHKEVVVIGGGEIYKEALVFASVAYITKVQTHIAGDTFFPLEKIEKDWHRISCMQDVHEAGQPVSEFSIYLKPKAWGQDE